MYKIIGADKKEYGPVTAAQVQQWISEGRANAQTLARAEGSNDWQPLSAFPEFADAVLVPAEPLSAQNAPPLSAAPPQEIAKGDYDLDIGACISRGWRLFSENVGTLIGGFLLILILAVVIQSLLGFVERRILPASVMSDAAFSMLLGYAVFLLSSLVIGPLWGGFYLVILRAIRGERRGLDSIFSGFEFAFKDLFLGYSVTGILTGLCFLPFNIVFLTKVSPLLKQMENAAPTEISNIFSQLLSAFASSLPLFLVVAIPAIYLSVSFSFTLPLIADRRLNFATAIKESWKMVNKHWWLIFGLFVLVGLINILGAICCGVGLLATMPVGYVARMFAYETIFSGKKSQDY